MRSKTFMSKINLQRGKLTVENRKSREKKRICSEVSVTVRESVESVLKKKRKDTLGGICTKGRFQAWNESARGDEILTREKVLC